MASIHEGFVQIHPELKLPLNNFINPNKNCNNDIFLFQLDFGNTGIPEQVEQH